LLGERDTFSLTNATGLQERRVIDKGVDFAIVFVAMGTVGCWIESSLGNCAPASFFGKVSFCLVWCSTYLKEHRIQQCGVCHLLLELL